MKLLADFGNTRVKVAVTDGDSFREVYCGPAVLSNLENAVQGIAIDGGMWCTVHQLDSDVAGWMIGLGMVPLTSTTPIPLKNGYSTPHTLGMDRLAAAVGAWSMNPGHDMLVIDAGTAITFDFISADGVFKGGNIAPGIGLRLRALHEHTGSLPLVSAEGLTPMTGYDTETAIRSGVIKGVRYEVEGYIRELESIYPSLLVFLTGGDADFFDIKGKSRIFAAPDLVLRGLARII